MVDYIRWVAPSISTKNNGCGQCASTKYENPRLGQSKAKSVDKVVELANLQQHKLGPIKN